jgi:hypothetical protein
VPGGPHGLQNRCGRENPGQVGSIPIRLRWTGRANISPAACHRARVGPSSLSRSSEKQNRDTAAALESWRTSYSP